MKTQPLNNDELNHLQGGVYYPQPGDFPGLGPISWPSEPTKPSKPGDYITRPYMTWG